jgi:hypothetical protein
MSTDPTGTTPTGATPAEPFTSPAAADPAAPSHDAGTTGADDLLSSGDGTGSGSGEEHESFFGRHSALLTALMAAVVVVAAAVAGLSYYRGQQNDDDAATEAAFSRSVQDRGATVETVECHGDTCSAVISGSAYTVLVQEDDNGRQHFGVTNYVGD